jgi:hypothetical protein
MMNKRHLTLTLLCFTNFIFSIMHTPSGLCPDEQKKLYLNTLKNFLKITERRKNRAHQQQKIALEILLSDNPNAQEYQKAYNLCLAQNTSQGETQNFCNNFGNYVSPELRQKPCYDKIYRPAMEKYLIKEYMAKNIKEMMQCINQLDNCDNANNCLKVDANISFPPVAENATQEEILARNKSHQEATKRLEKIIQNSSRTKIAFFHL